jgi:hypothetical protein
LGTWGLGEVGLFWVLYLIPLTENLGLKPRRSTTALYGYVLKDKLRPKGLASRRKC